MIPKNLLEDNAPCSPGEKRWISRLAPPACAAAPGPGSGALPLGPSTIPPRRTRARPVIHRFSPAPRGVLAPIGAGARGRRVAGGKAQRAPDEEPTRPGHAALLGWPGQLACP